MAYTTGGSCTLSKYGTVHFTVDYSIWGRTGTTVQLSLRVNVSAVSSYGYDMYAKPSINNVGQEKILLNEASPSGWVAFSIEIPASFYPYEITVPQLTQTTILANVLFTASDDLALASFNITIPIEASAITSSPNFNIGDNLPVSIRSASPSYTHTLKLNVAGSLVSTLTGIGNSTTFYLQGTTIATLYNLTPSTSSDVSIECITYNGGTLIGSTTTTGVAYVLPSRASPVFTDFLSNAGVIADANATTVALTANNTIMIKGKSNAQVMILVANKATSTTGASIVKYNVMCGGKTNYVLYSSTSTVYCTIGAIDSDVIYVSAVDSRGFVTTLSKTMNMKAYYTPYVITASTARDSGVGALTKLTLSAQYWSTYFGTNVNKNVVKCEYRYAITGTSTWSSYITVALTTSGDAISFNNYINGDKAIASEGFTAANSYNVEILLTDSLGSSWSYPCIINSGIPVMDMYRSGDTVGVGIGKVWTQGSIDAAGKIYSAGGLVPAIAGAGSNDNSSYIQYSDGTMIYRGYYSTSIVLTTITNGDFYISSEVTLPNFLVGFIAAPHCSIEITYIGSTCHPWITSSNTRATTTTPQKFYVMSNGYTSVSPIEYSYVAIGRWKL